MLKYKTRGMSNPQGKPRVYFCAHPADHRFFDEISDELLGIHNCAVWYDSTPEDESDDENLLEDLSQMQLFVIPVTTKFLTEECRAYDVGFHFAIEKHIPVLPIMLESGLDDIFNRKCGDLHYIDKNNREQSGESYSEKLKKYLDSVIIGDELAEKIRALAIAENDSSAEHNFFIGLDYLNGIDVEVDFERAVELIGGAAESGLCEAIEKLVSMYQNGEGVKRDYFTAVEWQRKLTEIRKEKFEQSGEEENCFELLESLFNLGDYLEALGKLTEAKQAYTEMSQTALSLNNHNKSNRSQRWLSISYDNLGNIESNLTRATDFYLKAFEIRKRLAEETETVQARCDLSVSYDNLGNIEEAQGNLSVAKDFYLKALDIREKLAEETETVQARLDLALSYENLSNIEEAQGNLTKATDFYLKELSIFDKLAEETEAVEARWSLAVNLESLGFIEKVQGNLTKATDFYLKELDIRERLAEETGTAEARRDLSISYEKLGDIERAQGNLTKATDFYLKALVIRERLAEETETVEARRDLSVRYNKLGDIEQAQGNLTKATEFYLKALDIRKRLAEETETVQAYDDLAVSYCNIALVETGSQRKNALNAAYTIWKRLCKLHPDYPEFKDRCKTARSLLKKR
ncbi:MAG: tetratricopeptide repeat protein [Acutalibacteraceae bacterium]|jgi:tetratricopeptide (TPR) repeat protein